jgi:hypothetical protein
MTNCIGHRSPLRFVGRATVEHLLYLTLHLHNRRKLSGPALVSHVDHIKEQKQQKYVAHHQSQCEWLRLHGGDEPACDLASFLDRAWIYFRLLVSDLSSAHPP